MLVSDQIRICDIHKSPKCANDSHHSSKCSIFTWVIHEVEEKLEQHRVLHSWRSHPDDQPSTLSDPGVFFFVWGALSFVSCIPFSDGVSPHRHFGDGIQVAGCVLLHILGLRQQYEMWNAARHVVDIFDSERSEKPLANTKMKQVPRHIWMYKKDSSASTVDVGAIDPALRERTENFVREARVMLASATHILTTLESISIRQEVSKSHKSFHPPQFQPPKVTSQELKS